MLSIVLRCSRVALAESGLSSLAGVRRFGTLATALAKVLKVKDAILDGEIVTKDSTGRPIFLDLLSRRGEVSYVAFDLLWPNGRDLRNK